MCDKPDHWVRLTLIIGGREVEREVRLEDGVQVLAQSFWAFVIGIGGPYTGDIQLVMEPYCKNCTNPAGPTAATEGTLDDIPSERMGAALEGFCLVAAQNLLDGLVVGSALFVAATDYLEALNDQVRQFGEPPDHNLN